MTTYPPLYLCTCEASQKIDAAAIGNALGLEQTPNVYSHLCRTQIDELSKAEHGGPAPIICCTQEAPVLLQAWQELQDENTSTDTAGPTFVDIRDAAGWSAQGDKASAKMAALIAESQVSVASAATVPLNSNGRTLVLGRDDQALETAKRLSSHFDVTVLLEQGTDISPPTLNSFPIFAGSNIRATGHLGAYSVSVDNLSVLEASSKESGSFGLQASDGALTADIIIDLRGQASLFPAPEKRDGYLHPDTGDTIAVERSLFDALTLVGEFEKPRYVEYNGAICAHSRSQIVACTRCIDTCPTGAITSVDEKIAIDPFVCAGCGSCASTCPTGAIAYQYSHADGLHDRARILLETYTAAGGRDPVLLIKDDQFGSEVISLIARFGDGLPANVLPFSVNEVTQIGIESLLAFGAFGASSIIIVADPRKADELESLKFQIELANTIMQGLGYGPDHIQLLIEQDPTVIEQKLYGLQSLPAMPGKPFVVKGPKRSALSTVLRELHGQAPEPVDKISLPEGAPLGTVSIDTENCTLCLSCVGSCPTGALKSNQEKPQLRFSTGACVQCGLCRRTCPEKVITLVPEVDFTQGARDAVILKEEEPFECISCGKPFATASSIKLMTEKLEGHAMFAAEGALDRLKMCEVCRVADIVNTAGDPWDTGKRPSPRTTNDYLKERDSGEPED